MRAFLAIEIPGSVRQLISDRINDVRDHFPPTRWVRQRAYHLTLLFLGEIDEQTAATLEDRLAPVLRVGPQFMIRFSGAGTFPSGRPARVAWIGLDRPEPVVALAGVIRDACRGLSEHAGSKPFTPHLTVGRCRRPWSRSVVKRWQSAFQGPFGDEFAVVRSVLMRSRLSQEGAHYDVISSFPLGSGGAI
jgi:2'-5' RNA ligase